MGNVQFTGYVAWMVELTNRMWFSVVCTLIDNDTRHHSDQNVVDSRGAAEWVRNKHIIDIDTTISKITKEIFAKHGLESARAALCKWAICTRHTFLSKPFANSLNIQKQYEKNVWETRNDAYSLTIRV